MQPEVGYAWGIKEGSGIKNFASLIPMPDIMVLGYHIYLFLLSVFPKE